MGALTKAQRVWFAYAVEHDGVCHNPYSMPKAAGSWRQMVAKSVEQGFVAHRDDVWARLRGGGFTLTDAGRAALEKEAGR